MVRGVSSIQISDIEDLLVLRQSLLQVQRQSIRNTWIWTASSFCHEVKESTPICNKCWVTMTSFFARSGLIIWSLTDSGLSKRGASSIIANVPEARYVLRLAVIGVNNWIFSQARNKHQKHTSCVIFFKPQPSCLLKIARAFGWI